MATHATAIRRPKRPRPDPRNCRRLLFVCTGNYYRSRFAEAVFNFAAAQRRIPWRATSAGLALDPNHSDLSPIARAALEERGIPVAMTGSTRQALVESHLAEADHIVAIDHVEHSPLIQRAFPEWLDKFEFWNVADTDRTPAGDALPAIESLVLQLADSLAPKRKAAEPAVG